MEESPAQQAIREAGLTSDGRSACNMLCIPSPKRLRRGVRFMHVEGCMFCDGAPCRSAYLEKSALLRLIMQIQSL